MTKEEVIEELKGCIIAEERGKDGKPNGNITCELTRDTLDMAIKALEQELTTKIDCNKTDCNNCVNHKYCDYEPTTKNDLGVDCISRQAVIDLMMQKWGENFSGDDAMQESIDAIRDLPSVTPQLSSELEKNSKKLEKDFGELDCISRADAIRVASGYCHPSNVAKELAKLPTVTPQEPFKPMVEIDLYSVIKQKYIEREVLDKIRAEIEQLSTTICTETRRIYIDADDFKENVLAIFDKYKAESEEE